MVLPDRNKSIREVETFGRRFRRGRETRAEQSTLSFQRTGTRAEQVAFRK